MKIVVTVEFDGRDPVAEMVKLFGESMMKTATVTAAPTGAKRGPGRPPAEKKVAPAPAPAQEATAAGNPLPAPAPAQEPTAASDPLPAAGSETAAGRTYGIDELRDAIKRVADDASVQVALDVLRGFGVKRVSDLKPEQHAPFMEQARKHFKEKG